MQFGNHFYQSRFDVHNRYNQSPGQFGTGGSPHDNTCDICMLQVDFIPVGADYSNFNQNYSTRHQASNIPSPNTVNNQGMAIPT